MLNKDNKDRNEIILKGEILKFYPIYRDEKRIGVILTLDVGNKCFPQVVAYGENAEKIWTEYFLHDTITLLCNAQSSVRENGRITTSIMCTKVLFNNVIAASKYNRMLIKGCVIGSVELKGNRLNLMVRTDTGGHKSTFYLLVEDYDPRLHSFEEGQPITVDAYVRTIKIHKIDGNHKHFTNYIINKIGSFWF